jgi:DNA-binding SARP family transcriptional activator|tara:strand:+ start:234 stop:1418 length:1185 start_codon:yes stop_codon:yes gene_type:complete
MGNHVFDLIENASDAAFAIDADRKITAWNATAQRLLGYSAPEVVGMRCGQVLQASLPGGEFLCHGDCDLFKCFLDCRPYGVPQAILKHRDGEQVSASIASIAMSQRARRIYADKVMAVVFLREGMATPPVTQQHRLQVFTLGGFGVTVAGRSVDIGKWKRKQAVALLKYLVNQLDHPVHRECLLDYLWPKADESQGLGRLKVAIYCLRRELRALGIGDDVLKTVGDTYILRRDSVWLDVDTFERLFAKGRSLQDQMKWGEALEHFAEARHLYRGDYLEEEVYADWCAEERGCLHELYLEMLARTAECHAKLEQYSEAVHICRKALVFDPCRENFHYALMEHLLSSGYPDLALAQYRQCMQILAQEFDASPLPKTQRLYEQILNGVDCVRESINK